MKFKEIRSNTIPIKPYTKIIYADFDNISTGVVDVLKALCNREKDKVLLIFASLYGRQNSVRKFLASVDSHYYGWIFEKNFKSPDLVDHALSALQVKFMMELGESSTKATHVLLSGDVALATSMRNNLSFAGVDNFVIIKNDTFQAPSKKPKTVDSDIEFVEELHRVLVNLNKKNVNLSLLGELAKPPKGKLKKVLNRIGIPMFGNTINPTIPVQKAVKVLDDLIN